MHHEATAARAALFILIPGDVGLMKINLLLEVWVEGGAAVVGSITLNLELENLEKVESMGGRTGVMKKRVYACVLGACHPGC